MKTGNQTGETKKPVGQDGNKKVQQVSVEMANKKVANKPEKKLTPAPKEKPAIDIVDEDEKVLCEKCKMPFKDTKSLENHTKEFHRIDSFAGKI